MSLDDMLRRVGKLEMRVDKLEEKVNKQDVVDEKIKGELKALRNEFSQLKYTIVTHISDFTQKVWKLIFVLVTIIALLSGIKSIPTWW